MKTIRQRIGNNLKQLPKTKHIGIDKINLKDGLPFVITRDRKGNHHYMIPWYDYETFVQMQDYMNRNPGELYAWEDTDITSL